MIRAIPAWFFAGSVVLVVCYLERADAQTREDVRLLILRKELARIEELAKEGNRHAKWAIGELARYYRNTKQFEEAARWYRRGAELGLVDHQVEYANLLVEGKGVDVNHQEAFAWYEKAATRGYEYAYLPLARLYAGGLGTGRDLFRAFALAELAALTFERGSDSPTRVVEARALQAQLQGQLEPRQIERSKNHAKEWDRRRYRPDG